MTPRPGKSYRSDRYSNLYKYPKRSRFWVYRRFSPEKAKDFTFYTGEETNEKAAHTIGEAAYFKWLGSEHAPSTRIVTFGQYATEHIERKLARTDEDFSYNSKRTSRNAVRHLVEAFETLRLDQVTEEVWEDYVSRCLREKPQKFFNRRKELNEILGRAFKNGMIRRMPEFRNPDPRVDAGRYLSDKEVAALIKNAAPDTALLIEIMWRQGPRPSEALQYRWDMIDWKAGEAGTISIPANITKTRRARTIPLNRIISKLLKARKKASKSPWVFPSPDTDGPIGDYTAGWEGARARAQIDCVLYDLRRTFITNQAKKGTPILFVARYVDSSVQMIERFYAKVQHTMFKGIV